MSDKSDNEKSDNESNKSYSDEDDFSGSGSDRDDDYNSEADEKRLIESDGEKEAAAANDSEYDDDDEDKKVDEDDDDDDDDGEEGKIGVASGGVEEDAVGVSFAPLPSSSKAAEAAAADDAIPLIGSEPAPQQVDKIEAAPEKKKKIFRFNLMKPKAEKPKQPKTQSMVSQCLKYSLMVFCMVFWIIGGFFAAVGGYQVSQLSDYEELSDFATDAPLIFTALGCLVFIISSFGVLGAYRENICFLRVYKIFLIIIIVFEFCAGLVGFAFWPETKKFIQVTLERGIKDYYDSPMLQDLMDMLQKDLQCCGSQNFDDWDSNWYFRCKNVAGYRHCGVPWSCCVVSKEEEYRTNVNRQCGFGIRKTHRSDLEGRIYTDGCLEVAFGFFKDNLTLIALLGVVFTVPLFVGIYMALRLVKQIKKQVRAVDPVLYEKMRKDQTIKCCMTNVLADDAV